MSDAAFAALLSTPADLFVDEAPDLEAEVGFFAAELLAVFESPEALVGAEARFFAEPAVDFVPEVFDVDFDFVVVAMILHSKFLFGLRGAVLQAACRDDNRQFCTETVVNECTNSVRASIDDPRLRGSNRSSNRLGP